MVRNKLIIPLLFSFSIFFFWSCSTKRAGFTHRYYHNMTAHYNAYFNGIESFKEGVATIEKSHVDNYDKVLPVFKFGSDDLAKSIYPQMDRSIKKASLVIQRHSIFIKGKEYCDWIDDAYMLMGKANFYKREYYNAIEIFQYIMGQYKNSPMKYEAMVWLARTYTQMGKYPDATGMFNALDEPKVKSKIPDYLIKEIDASKADMYIKQKIYYLAIDPLNKALKETKKKKIKTRYTFILAQLMQKAEENDKAFRLYTKTIKMNAVYEMEFNAKINMAKLYGANTAGGTDIKKQLRKMVRDSKNIDYLDQIYFALAEIAFKEKDNKEAVRLLKLSAASSTTNNYQKSVSFLRLADFYFVEPDYEYAQVYYDSTMAFLAKDFPNYKDLERKQKTLGEISKNIKTIHLEDSLQQLAKMPARDRDAVINEIINNLIKEEERKRQEEIDRQQQLSQMSQNSPATNNPNLPGGNQWYFYNPSAISFGYNEFVKKYGNRKLEDNWRRSNKEIIDDFGEMADNSVDTAKADSIKKKTTNLKDKNYYLKSIPLTPEQLAKSDAKIIDAYYNLGIIYHEKLQDDEESTKSFENLLKQYKGNTHELTSYYYLYRIYQDKQNTTKADYYKNKILSEYANSDVALLIKDPEAFKKSQEEKNKSEQFYKETYLAYLGNNYEAVIKNNDVARATYPNNPAMPRFDFLKALSIGKTQDVKSFEIALDDVVKKHAKDPVAKEAQQILTYIRKSLDSTKKAISLVKDPGQIYKQDTGAIHFYGIVVSILDADINKTKVALSDFNLKNYSNSKLQVASLFIDEKNQIITVGNFESKSIAKKYFDNIQLNKNIFFEPIKGKYTDFIITTDNYTIFFKDKKLDSYLKFYNANYK